jgi:hypothetical protein
VTVHPAERGELEAFHDLYRAAPAGLGARVEELGGAVCIALPEAPRSAMFNRVLGLGPDRPATRGELDEMAGFFGVLGAEWCVALAPQAEPPDLGSWLTTRGFVPG